MLVLHKREYQALRILSLSSKDAGWIIDIVTEGLYQLNNSSIYYSSHHIRVGLIDITWLHEFTFRLYFVFSMHTANKKSLCVWARIYSVIPVVSTIVSFFLTWCGNISVLLHVLKAHGFPGCHCSCARGARCIWAVLFGFFKTTSMTRYKSYVIRINGCAIIPSVERTGIIFLSVWKEHSQGPNERTFYFSISSIKSICG